MSGIDRWTKGGDERHSAPMRIGIIGAGAIGGWVAARLVGTGEPVSLLARGAAAEALRDGLELVDQGALTRAHPRVAEHAAELGEQDLLVIAVKAPSLAKAAAAAAPMIGPGTIILPMLNGVPW